MKTKRITMSISDENLLEKIKMKYSMTNEEAISFCIQTTYNQLLVLTDDVVEERSASYIEKEILEYVKLLVKANKELPPKSDPEEMERYVNAPTRFDELVERKINNK